MDWLSLEGNRQTIVPLFFSLHYLTKYLIRISQSIFRSDEIGRFTDTLQGALDRGEDAMVKVYIGYLASRLNEVTKYDDVNIWGQQRLNKSSNNVVLWKDFLEGKRARLLEVLKDLPVRDEVRNLDIHKTSPDSSFFIRYIYMRYFQKCFNTFFLMFHTT